MKRYLYIAALTAAMSGAFVPATAWADPGGPNLQEPRTFTCDGGLTLDVNPGTATNFGRVAWDIDSTSVLVVNYFAVTFADGSDAFVFFDQAPGLTNLITCTSPAGPGATFVAKGFVTPRNA